MRLDDQVNVLDADPGLRGDLEGEALDAARRVSVVRTMVVDPGPWEACDATPLVRGGHGLLVLGGLVMRGVGHERRFGAEVIEAGDVLRPWEHDGEQAVLPFQTVWEVLETVHVALLDARWTRDVAGRSQIADALMSRLHMRTLRLAATMAIARQATVTGRVHLLLWHFAERRGRVTPDGVHLDLPLTQTTLGDMIGVGRQAVSVALGELEADGTVRRAGRSFVLTGEPPPVG